MTNDTFEFTMKDTSGSYGWLLEGSTDLKDVEAMGVQAWIEATAKTLINGSNYGDTSDDQVYQTWIDDTYEFEQVVKFMQSKIDEANVEAILDSVMTAGEATEEFHLGESTVRQAINRDGLIARKSGGTWIFLRKHAEARWGKKS